MTAQTETYQGVLRVLDPNGFLLDVGSGDLAVTDREAGSWRGTITVFTGSCLCSKSITALVEVDDGRRALAQVGPEVDGTGSELVSLKVVGLEPPPF